MRKFSRPTRTALAVMMVISFILSFSLVLDNNAMANGNEYGSLYFTSNVGWDLETESVKVIKEVVAPDDFELPEGNFVVVIDNDTNNAKTILFDTSEPFPQYETIDDLSMGSHTIIETETLGADVDYSSNTFDIGGTANVWADIKNDVHEVSFVWYLFRADSGNPKPASYTFTDRFGESISFTQANGNGSAIAEEESGYIDEDGKCRLSYEITQPGIYIFAAPNVHTNPNAAQNITWSNPITVTAKDLEGLVEPTDPEITITNTFEPTSTPKLIVEKTFVDYPDDVTKTATVTVSGGNDFSGSNTFTENGTWDVCEITSGETYTITEDSLTGVDFSFGSGQVTINDGSFTIPVSQTDDVTITVTNTYNPPSESNKLKIVKNFVNYADNDIAETADFSLMFTTPDPAVTIGTHTFNGSGAAWTLYELTPGEYRLQETAAANVAVTFASTDVAIDENGVFLFPEDKGANITITVTNTYNPPLVYHSYLQIEKRLTGEVPDPEPTGFMARIEKWVDEVILRQIGGSWQTFMDNIALTAGQTTDPIEVDPYASYRVVEYQIGGADQVTYDLLNGDGIYDEISAEGVPIGENETRTIRVTNHYKGQSGGGGDSKKSYIKVSKNVTGDGPSGGYQVTIYGYEGYETEGEPAVVKTFTIRDGQTISTEVEPGVYSVQESAVDHSRFLGVDYTLNNDNYDPADTFVVGEDDTRSIVITNRFSTSGGGGDDPGSSGGGEESVVIPPEPPVVQPPVVQPPVVTPPLEPVIIPEVLPELPKTGASNILLTAMGLLLAGGGMILRRRS